MRTTASLLRSTILSAAAVVAFGAISVPVMAQDDYDSGSAVTVVAPRITHERTGQINNDGLGLPVERMSVSYDVDYSDLNMSRRSDRMRLEERIDVAASNSCRELHTRFPDSSFVPTHSDFNENNCQFQAVRAANDQLSDNLAAAHQ